MVGGFEGGNKLFNQLFASFRFVDNDFPRHKFMVENCLTEEKQKLARPLVNAFPDAR